MTLLNRIWNRLDLRLTLLILLLSVLPLVILGVVALNSSQRTLEKQQFNHLNAVTLLKADEINRWTESNVLQLNALAQRPLVREFANTLSQVGLNTAVAQSTRDNLLANHLLPTLTGEGGFWELFLLDADSGQILASTDEDDVGKYRNSEAYFIEGKNVAYVQNVYYKVSLGQPVMTIGTPVRNEQGMVVAVLAGHLDLAMLATIAEQTNDLMSTEDTYLVNSFNFFVTDPRFGENYALQETVQTEGISRCLRQESGHAIYEDYRGDVVLGAYQWLPQRELCVITEIDQVEAMGPINTLRRSLSVVGMLVALGVVTSGLFFTRSITRPLYRLMNGVERIGRGKLDYQIPVHGQDDIGRLTTAFNQMSDNLHHSIGKNLHGQKLLLTLSQAAQAVQQARTSEEVYATMSAEMAKLGFDSSVLLLTEDQEHVRVAHMGYDLAVVRTAEKLTGLSAATFKFPLPPGGYFEQVIKGGKTIFISPMGDFVAEALPKKLHILANRVAAMLGMEQGIIAPLIVDDVPLGVLTVTGDSLSEVDVTAVSTFASQTAIALQNAQSIDQLQQSEARFRAIFEHAGMGVARVDLEGKPLESNPALQAMLGYDAEELRNMPFTEFTHPEDATIDMTLYQSLIAGERDVYEIEKRYVRKDGDLVWARLTVSLVRDMGGEPLFAVGMVHDITEQKKNQQAHTKQRAFLKSIYDGADLAIFVVDVTADGAFRFGGLNPAHERLTGLKSDDVQGKMPHDLVPYIPPEAADAIHANYARCLAAEKAISYEEMIPMGGQETWWLTRLSPLKDENGRTYRIVGTSLSITERKRAEQELERYREKLEELVAARTAELQQSEARFRALFQAVPIPVSVSRVADGAILEANEHVAEAIGIPIDQVKGYNVADLYRNKSERAGRVDYLVSQGHVRGHELEIVRPDGALRTLLLSTAVVEYEGQPALLSGFQDVTERKNMEEALRYSEERFRALVQHASDVITIADAEGTITYESPALETVLGFQADERLGQNVLALALPEQQEEVTAAFAALQQDPTQTVKMEVHVLHKNGSRRLLEVTATNLLANPAVNGIVVNSHDITARVQAEEAVRASEQRYRTLTESSPDMIFLINPDMTVDYANRVAVRQFGKEATAVIGQPHTTLFPPEIAARQQQALQQVLTSGEMIQAESKVKFPRGDVWLHTRLVPIAANGHGVTAVLGISRDITSLKEAELALQKKAVDLERSNKELEQFAYVASHDLQEPLRMVTNYMQLLQRRYQGQLDEKADKYIDFAVDGATRMKVLIDDLLTYSRVGTRGKAFAPVSVALVLQQVLDDLQLSIKETGATISHEALPTIMADGNQIGQLFQNLIGNAIKFRGETEPQVHIGVEKQDDMWHFCVQDNGIGIDPRFAERIFVIFQRLHTRTHYGGTGIGLAICKKIVERHGGQIWVESQPDSGTTFHFTIPTNNHDKENDSPVTH